MDVSYQLVVIPWAGCDEGIYPDVIQGDLLAGTWIQPAGVIDDEDSRNRRARVVNQNL